MPGCGIPQPDQEWRRRCRNEATARARCSGSPRFVIILLGFALGAGGAWLLGLGGSWYYLAAGFGFVLTGLLLLFRSRAALWVYAVVVLGTVAWAVAEIGLDWWPLAARGDIVFLVGLWLLMPWITRGLRRHPADPPPAAWRGAGLPLAVALLIGAVAGVAAMVTDRHDRPGELPAAQGPVPQDYGGVPDGDWRGLWPILLRQPLVAADRDHAGAMPASCRSPGTFVPAMSAAPTIRRDHLRGDADQGPRHPLPVHAAQFRDRAGRRDRPREVALRPQDLAIEGAAAPDLPRRLLSRGGGRPGGNVRRLQPPHLHADRRRPADRARRRHRHSPAPASARTGRSICGRACPSGRRACTTRPRRRS